MTAPREHIHVWLAPAGTPRETWAAEELLARLRLPWTPLPPAADSRPVSLAIGTALPQGAAGVQLAPAGTADPLDLARRLAAGGLNASSAERLGPGRFGLPVDLAGAFEAWLGRREETLDGELDAAGRVRHERSALAAAIADVAPVAEILAEGVLELLARAAGEAGLALPPRQDIWPEGKTFAVHLSHDVDSLAGRYQLWRRYAGWSARWVRARLSGRRQEAAGWAAKLRRLSAPGEDPEYTIPRILELEGRHNATSSFYFFCSRTSSTRGRHASRMYRITDPLAREAIGRVREAGSEVGLHAFPGDRLSASRLARGKALLEELGGETCLGVRQHYLCLSVPETWRAQREAGFDYDATLGWPYDLGMRAGTCMPFETFDARAGEPIGLMEVPLIVMDAAVEMRWPNVDAWLEGLLPLLEGVRRVGGVFGFLMHPNRFCEADWPGQASFYEAFVQEAARLGGWLASGRDILRASRDLRARIRLSPWNIVPMSP